MIFLFQEFEEFPSFLPPSSYYMYTVPAEEGCQHDSGNTSVSEGNRPSGGATAGAVRWDPPSGPPGPGTVPPCIGQPCTQSTTVIDKQTSGGEKISYHVRLTYQFYLFSGKEFVVLSRNSFLVLTTIKWFYKYICIFNLCINIESCPKFPFLF